MDILKNSFSIYNADQNFTISRKLMFNLLLTYVGITVYLAFAWSLLKQWLFFLIDDREMSRKQHFLSGIILVLITIFWPIVVPFAYIELLKFHRKHNKEIDLLKN
ncbi:hypothetical protein [Nostoc sp.]|uniref:hypothetical protein n=1 Tax=Nostoc sp. TaxID=1180 RepID=UPI002FF9F766